MEKKEAIRNVGLTTLPVCLVIFAISWLIFKNPIAAAVLPLILLIASIHNNISKYFYDIKRDAAKIIKHKFKLKKAYELIAPNDAVAPSLCIETQDNKYVLINGQWIYDKDTYGEGAEKYINDESDIFNCYNKPFSFPSSEFEIWVSELDNEPFRIVVSGEYIEPEQTKWKTPKDYYYSQFAIIDKSDLKADGSNPL